MIRDHRNALEIRLHELINKLSAYLHVGGKVTRMEYFVLAGELRDVKHMLNNKQYGCWSGMHVSICDCTPDVVGKTIRNRRLEKA